MPGAMEGREDEHVAQPRVLRGQGSPDHTSLVFSRGFGQWEDAGVPLPSEWEEPALGDGWGTARRPGCRGQLPFTREVQVGMRPPGAAGLGFCVFRLRLGRTL